LSLRSNHVIADPAVGLDVVEHLGAGSKGRERVSAPGDKLSGFY